LKIQNDKESLLFNNNLIPPVIKNYNINYLNVSYQLVIEFLKNQISHPELQPDINALSSFINSNSKELTRWSVVLAQKPNNSQDIGDLSWDMDFYGKDNLLSSNRVTGIVRTPTSEDDETLMFTKFLDSDIDNTFDIIDENNIKDYVSLADINKSNKRYNYRNKKKMPILIIYIVKGKDFVFPLYYITIPLIDGGQKVRYIIRNN
jgi:hypothetical protein